MEGFQLAPTKFVENKILSTYVTTAHIKEKINKFFNRLNVYEKYGTFPKRGVLLYGPPGTGKTTAITDICKEYGADKNTCIVVWHTDKYEAYQVKDFIKSFEYPEDVKRFILVAEDLGGVEVAEVRRSSDSSLLSLLDNQEKTFKIPTLILATTNHPEVFLGNITNRPDRFDDKFEVGFPPHEARGELLKFFGREDIKDLDVQKIVDKKYKEFSPSHIKEVVIRAAIHDKTIINVIDEIYDEIESYKKAFSKSKSVGFQ